MDFSAQLSLLIQLSLVDGDISNTEKDMIFNMGKANGMSHEGIEKILHHHLRNSRHELPDLSNLTEDDKITYLYNIIRLMKADKEIYLTEIKYCENIAEKLGFKKKVIREMSSKVFSDGTVNTDVEQLKQIVDKYRV
ncbi:MAG: TerB family tellurite resistance protein [Cyclobacteriaceae bacterium]